MSKVRSDPFTQLTNGDLRTDFFYDGLGRLRARLEYYIPPEPATNPPPEETLATPLGGDSPGSWTLVSETDYIYDGWRVIQERDGANNTPTVSYTRGRDLSGSLEGAGGIGGLLGRSAGYSSGNWTTHAYYFADGNGNITYLVNSSQTIAARYRYDPYGNAIIVGGAWGPENVYRFSSKEIHVNSGLYYYGFRWYAPNLQRWLNRDPLQELGGINLYGFVANNPVNGFDPWGNEEKGRCRRAWDWVSENVLEPAWIAIKSVFPNDDAAKAAKGTIEIYKARTNELKILRDDDWLRVTPEDFNPRTNSPPPPKPPATNPPIIWVPGPVGPVPVQLPTDPKTGKK